MLKDIRFLRRFYDSLLGGIQLLLGVFLLRGVSPERIYSLPDWVQVLSMSPIYALTFIVGGLVLILYRTPRPVIVSLLALVPLLTVYLLQLYLSLTHQYVIRSSAFNIIFEMIIITMAYLLFRVNEDTRK